MPYVSHEDIESMSMDLKIYDVDQHGWEHEDKGLEFNLDHVLTEVVRARRKDFFDPKVVREELTPDAIQYALRIARWTGFKRELVLPDSSLTRSVDEHAKLIRTPSTRIAAYAAGEVMLADFTHKLDHEREAQAAQQFKMISLSRISQAFMSFALESAHEFNFQPRAAFIDRLSGLRERFGIPQPR